MAARNPGGEERERRDHRLSQVRSLNYALLSQRKTMITYVRSVDNALSTFKMRVTSCRNVYLAFRQ